VIDQASKLPWLSDILNKILATMEAKNSDYAIDDDWKSNFRHYGLFGMAARLSDKVQRMENLLFRNKSPEVLEAIEDTLEDMAAYAVLLRQAFLEGLPIYGDFQGRTDDKEEKSS
jgi:hypothetical protein